MDKQKLHDLIDKVIGKSGPLRAPAWWMRKVLMDVADKAESDVAALEKKVDSDLKALDYDKVSHMREYTYIELCELRDRAQLIPGQQYRLIDYEPVLTEKYEGRFTTSRNGYGIVLTASTEREFSQTALAFESEQTSAFVNFRFHDSSHYADWCIDDMDSVESVTLDNGAQLRRVGVRLFEVIKNEEIIGETQLYPSSFAFGAKLSVSVSGINVRGIVESYVTRNKGNIVGYYNPSQNVRAFWDFNHIKEGTTSNSKQFAKNCSFQPVPIGTKTLPYIICSQVPVNVLFHNVDNLTLGANQYVFSDAIFINCKNLTINGLIRNAVIMNSINEETKTLDSLADCIMCGDNIMASKRTVGTETADSNQLVNSRKEPIYPKTITSEVTDETSGKTLDTVLPLIVDVSAEITQETYDALDAAIDSGRQIAVISGTGFSPMPAVGMRNSDGEGVILTVQVQTQQSVVAVPFRINPGEAAMIHEGWRMVKAGQGVEIEADGTLNCTLDTSPFIIPSDGNLPVEGQEGKIYLIPATNTGDQNVMLEYVWVNGAWEKFGEFTTEVDLSQYAKLIDLRSLSPEDCYNMISTHKGEAIYRYAETYAYYGGAYSTYFYLLSLSVPDGGNTLYSTRAPRIAIYEFTRSGSSIMFETLVISNQLSSYASIHDSVYKIDALNVSIPTEVKDKSRPIMLDKDSSVGGIMIPITADLWVDGAILREVRTYVSDGYLHTWKKLNALDSETTQELLEVARALSESTELSPKTYNALGTLAADTVLTMNAGRHTVPEYQGEFSFGDTAYAVTFPEEVKWSSDSILDFKANSTYQFRILNGLGVLHQFDNTSDLSAYAQKTYVDEAISTAIVNVLNTEV